MATYIEEGGQARKKFFDEGTMRAIEDLLSVGGYMAADFGPCRTTSVEEFLSDVAVIVSRFAALNPENLSPDLKGKVTSYTSAQGSTLTEWIGPNTLRIYAGSEGRFDVDVVRITHVPPVSE